MDRRELHDAVESCHARAQSEDMYNSRKRDVNEINDGMIEIKAWFKKWEESNCGKMSGKGS